MGIIAPSQESTSGGDLPPQPSDFNSFSPQAQDAIRQIVQHLSMGSGASTAATPQSAPPLAPTEAAPSIIAPQSVAQAQQPADFNSLAPHLQDAVRKVVNGGGIPGYTAGGIPQPGVEAMQSHGPNPGGDAIPATPQTQQVPQAAQIPQAPQTPQIPQTPMDYKAFLEKQIEGTPASLAKDKSDWEGAVKALTVNPATGAAYSLPGTVGIEKVIGGKGHTVGDIATLVLGLVAATMGKNGQQFLGGLLQGWVGSKYKEAEDLTTEGQRKFQFEQQQRAVQADAALKKLGFDQSEADRMRSEIERVMQNETRNDLLKRTLDEKGIPQAATADRKVLTDPNSKKEDRQAALAHLETLHQYGINVTDQDYTNAQRDGWKVDSSARKDIEAQIKGITDRNATPTVKMARLAELKRGHPEFIVTPDLEKAAAEVPPDVALKQQKYEFLKTMDPERLRNLQNRTLGIISRTAVTDQEKQMLAKKLAAFEPAEQARLANIYSAIATRGTGVPTRDLNAAYGANQRAIADIEKRYGNGIGGVDMPALSKSEDAAEYGALQSQQADLRGKLGAKIKTAESQQSPPVNAKPGDIWRHPGGATYKFGNGPKGLGWYKG